MYSPAWKQKGKAGVEGGEDLLHTLYAGETCCLIDPRVAFPIAFHSKSFALTLQKAWFLLFSFFWGNKHNYKARNLPKKPLRECFSALISSVVKLSVKDQVDFPTTPGKQCFKLKGISIHPCARDQVVLFVWVPFLLQWKLSAIKFLCKMK